MHVIARLPPIVRFMTKQNSIWSKALIMPLTIWNCVLSYKQKNYFSENRLVLPRNYFHNRIPRWQQVANGIFRWQICYLLLLISNPVLPYLFGLKWEFSTPQEIYRSTLHLLLLCCCFKSMVNSYGYVGTVS